VAIFTLFDYVKCLRTVVDVIPNAFLKAQLGLKKRLLW